jgi:hypothetical protein
MDPARFLLRTGHTAALVVGWAELTPDSDATLAESDNPRDFVTRLVEAEAYGDAVGFLAHALPRREAVWWAWLCARTAAGDSPAEPVARILATTHAWIAEPSDANRRTAYIAAEESGIGTAHGLAALAVFLSGDSLAPPHMEPIRPGPHDGAKAVVGAVMLAAVAAKPDQPAEAFRDFISQGLALAERTKLWQPPQQAGA